MIAMSSKRLSIKVHRLQRLERDDVECDLTFRGFIVFANRLLPETTPVISELNK